MQIVHGGKVSRLHDFLVIRGKTFAIVRQFETPYNRKKKKSLENLRDWRLIRKNRETFPPLTICIIRYALLNFSRLKTPSMMIYGNHALLKLFKHLLKLKILYWQGWLSFVTFTTSLEFYSSMSIRDYSLNLYLGIQ